MKQIFNIQNMGLNKDYALNVYRDDFGTMHFDGITGKWWDATVETSDENARALADAIYNDQGLGWLPYPENTPGYKDNGTYYEVTEFVVDSVDKYQTDTLPWICGLWVARNVIAYRIPAPYQPD